MSIFGDKYNVYIKKYLTSTAFDNMEKLKERENIIYFFTNIGFLGSVNFIISLYLYFSKKNIIINDMYWNGKCNDNMGLECYFSKKSLLVKILNNKKKLDRNTSYTLLETWIKVDEKLYDKINKLKIKINFNAQELDNIKQSSIFHLKWYK